MPRKNSIEKIAEEIREDLRIPFPATSGAIREAFLKTQEPTGSLYIPVCQDSYPEAKKAIDSITRCPGSNPENQHTENIRQKVTLAVLMPKEKFLRLCNTYQKEGFLYDHVDFEKVAETCHVSKQDAIERFVNLQPNTLL